MGFTSLKLFSKGNISKYPVETWTQKEVKAWCKLIDLPKSCREALKPVNGKVLLAMTADDFCALFEHPPANVYVSIFVDALAKLQQGHCTVSRASSRSSDSKGAISDALFGEKKSTGAAAAGQSGQLPLSKLGQTAFLGRIDVPCKPTPEPPFSFNDQDSCDGVKKGEGSPMDEEAFNDDENVSHNAPQAASGEENIPRDISMPLGFAPSSQLSSVHQCPDVTPDEPREAGAAAAAGPAAIFADLPGDVAGELSAVSPLEAPTTGTHAQEVSADDGRVSPYVQSDKGMDMAGDRFAGGLGPDAEDPCMACKDSGKFDGPLSPDMQTARVGMDVASAGNSALQSVPYESPPRSISELSAKTDPSPLAMPEHYHADSKAYSMALEEHASYLRGFTEACSDEDITVFLQPIDRVRDLVDACRLNIGIGHVFAAIYEAHCASFAVNSIPAVAAHFRDFCMSVLAALGVSGRRQLMITSDACQEIAEGFDLFSDLLQTFSRPGWFLHLAFMENIKGRLDAAHDRIARALQSVRASELPDGRMLHSGDYTDPSRAVRRVLKQVGQGSIADGASAVAAHSGYQANVADVLNVPLPVLAAEFGSLPKYETAGARIDLAKMYASLNAAAEGGPLRVKGADLDEHRAIFKWYDDGGKGFLDAGDLKRVLHDLGLLDAVRDKDHFVGSQLALADQSHAGALSLPEFSAYYSSLVFAGERHQLRSKVGIEVEEELKHQFLAFANFGVHTGHVSEMDGAHFAKYCNDCRILRGGLTITDVDLTFAKVKAKGARRISFDQFLRALNILAEKRGSTFSDIIAAAIKHVAPVNHATARVTNVRLHDDKSTYTGVYARGGPVAYDGAKDLSQITNRKPADHRGVALPSSRTATPRRRSLDGSARSGGRGMPASPTASGALSGTFSVPADAMSLTGSLTPPLASARRRASVRSATPTSSRLRGWETFEPLQRAFISFALFGKGHLGSGTSTSDIKMDSKAFAKTMKEAGVMDGRLNTTRVDLTFTRVADKTSKRMSYAQFQAALALCAEVRGVDAGTFTDVVAHCQPLVSGTIAQPVKWHDDKSTYTGVYARGGPSMVDKKANLQDMVDRDSHDNVNRRLSLTPSWAH